MANPREQARFQPVARRGVVGAAALGALVTMGLPSARADEQEPSSGLAGHGPVDNRVNLRAGAASSDTTGRPTICLEVLVVRALGVEACGTGAGILHHEDGQEMAHFRAHWALIRRALPTGQLSVRAGVGFAELQLADDDPGFQFGSPDARAQSVAGGELSLSAQWLVPAWRGWDVVANVTVGGAYFAGAKELAQPAETLQPFVSFELGVGW